MDHYQKKEQNYAKWNESIWLSVEKEISYFQMKVTDCMLSLGDLQKKNVEDFKVMPDVQVLGENFYLQLIRPECVKKGYLDKKIPRPEDLENSDESQDEESQPSEKEKTQITKIDNPKVKKQNKKKKAKNAKQQNKMKVMKENFLKEVDTLFDTFTLNNLNVTFGFNQKKLQVKLLTFFYIALYIKKNKVKKDIQESQIFQIISIMTKVVRIFQSYEREQTKISQTLILELKLCIKGLKDYYNYTNKKVIINYPKLIYYTNYDQYFPTLDIKPYPSQIEFIQSVKRSLDGKGSIDRPTLILYKTMIGSGKTSASIALSQLIQQTKLVDAKNSKYQILYSCLIGSVRIQVGRYAYNKNQKFALAAMEKSIKDQDYYYPRIINSYSCRNQKVVDLVISDLSCTYEMLHHHHLTKNQQEIFQHEHKNRKKPVKVGKLDRENIVLFVDEPTAFCKDQYSPATTKLFQILANYPPKLTILASATMPDQTQLPNTIKLIERKNPGLQVFQVESKEFQIGCQYCSFKGQVIFPHTNVANKEELLHIINILQTNPFLLRLYTGPSLFFLLKKCQKYKIKGLPKINQLSEVRQSDIIKATFKILKILKNQENEVIEDICKLSADQTNLQYKVQEKNDSDDDFFQEEEKQKVNQSKNNYVNFKAMLRKDAHKFLGGCLIATQNPLNFAKKYFGKWVEKIKSIGRLIQKYEKEVEHMQKQIKLLEDDTEMREEKKSQQISKLQFQKAPSLDFPVKKKINTIDHYEKYCIDKEQIHKSMLIKPVPLQSVGEQLRQEVDDFVLKLLFCGVAIYMEKGLSPKYLDKVEELASQNFLAYIITDQSLCYGTNFPISNVILCDDLVTKLNMNEMFQLVGRAGRVGQSWTARAFLEEEGLKKLNHYIHSKEEKVSDQALVFEKIARYHLNNPQLTLRTAKSEIKYANIQNPGNQIQVIIKKKKQEDYHIFRKVVVVPFLNGKAMTMKQPYETFHSYLFPSSDILYEDMPTTKNEDDEDIIDVTSYYVKQQEFIRKTLNNTFKRILKESLDGSISSEGQLNEFLPKVYEEYFCSKTNTFVIMVKVKGIEEIGQYKIQNLKSNSMQYPGDFIVEKLNDLLSECRRICPALRENPTNILVNDVKNIRQNHENFLKLDRIPFYREIYEKNKNTIQEEYEAITKNIEDKQSIECRNQEIIALIFQTHEDLVQIVDKVQGPLFHIDRNIRPIWNNIVKKLDC